MTVIFNVFPLNVGDLVDILSPKYVSLIIDSSRFLLSANAALSFDGNIQYSSHHQEVYDTILIFFGLFEIHRC
jgi:hypothetical protein